VSRNGVAHFRERHARTSPGERLGGRDAAARGSHDNHPAFPDREFALIHTITAASTSSD
jgi:hypothetical protein